LNLLEEAAEKTAESWPHQSGDWSDRGAEDRTLNYEAVNDEAVQEGLSIFSAYDTPARRAWVVTEDDRLSRLEEVCGDREVAD